MYLESCKYKVYIDLFISDQTPSEEKHIQLQIILIDVVQQIFPLAACLSENDKPIEEGNTVGRSHRIWMDMIFINKGNE